MKVWFITNKRADDEDTSLSLVGIFSTKEIALDYLKNEVLGSESFNSISWEQSEYNSEYFEGIDAVGRRRFILSTAEVDNP